MLLLIAGLLLFTIVHLFPSALAESRTSLVEKLGTNPYRGLFSVAIVVALALIVVGWKSATPTSVYLPPFGSEPMILALVFLAFVLLVAAKTRTNIRRYVRHPQMAAVILWSIAHLLVNGDSRSVALFGGLGAWAVIEMLLCSRRDGAWKKPERAPIVTDAVTVAIGAAGFAITWYFHQALFGVSA
ncbi:MAG: hypothetical protein KAJ57_05720 [Woeseiaceae bacterium]|nr:hypothetical protein [Woeseiaceae bacterium]